MADLSSLEEELRSLKDRVTRLEERLIGAASSVPPPPAPPLPPVRGSGLPSIPPITRPPRAPRESLEKSIGTRWFNILGAAALIFGIGYFLKYAIDNEWIGPGGRVALGLLSGAGLLAWADYFRGRGKYRILSLGMTGVGIAALYLSFYAAYDFYHLIPQSAAFACMLATTGVSAFLALRYNAITIAIIALFGGFLTPLLVSSGENKPVELFSYLLLLNAGVLALAFRKNWKILNVLAIAWSYIWYVSWHAVHYSHDQFTVAFGFLSAFFIVFAFISFLYNILNARKTGAFDLIVILTNAIVYFPIALLLLEHDHDTWEGFFSLAVAGLFIGLGFVAYRRSQSDVLLQYAFLSIAVTCLVIAVPLQLDGRWVSVAWATEGLALWVVGLKVQRRAPLFASLVVFLVGLFSLPAVEMDYHFYNEATNRMDFTPLFNGRFASHLYFMLSLFAASYLRRSSTFAWGKLLATAGRIMSAVATIGLLATLHAEVDTHYESLKFNLQAGWSQDSDQTQWTDIDGLTKQESFVISGLWATYSFVLIGIGIKKKSKLLRILAMCIFGMTIVKVAWDSLLFLDGFYRVASLIGLGVVLFLVSFAYQKYKGVFDEPSKDH